MTRLVLASASPRRHALLSALGLHFDVIISSADEDLHGPPETVVVVNARKKRDDVAVRLDSPAIVIAADTLVFLNGEPLGKPADQAEAAAMLGRLSGHTHQVITGVSLVDTARAAEAEGFERTDVTFRTLTDHEIHRFIEAVNPIDRAGAYTVDGPGSLLIEAYHGCYQNVLGLPIVRLDSLLRELGYNLFDLMDHSRCSFL